MMVVGARGVCVLDPSEKSEGDPYFFGTEKQETCMCITHEPHSSPFLKPTEAP
jgi:hypothetical protein